MAKLSRIVKDADLQDKYKTNNENTKVEIKYTDSPLFDEYEKYQKQQDGEQIYMLDPDEIEDYTEEVYRLPLHTGHQEEITFNSIKEHGFYTPAVVWEKDGKYITLAGHNRKRYAKKLGIKLPCIIRRNLTEEQARDIVIITNILNRQIADMKPSEVGLLFSLTINNLSEDELKDDAYTKIQDKHSLSKTSIRKYLKIYNSLNQKLLEMLDNDKIPLEAAYMLACRKNSQQEALVEFVIAHNIDSISLKDVDKITVRKDSTWDNKFLSKVFGIDSEEKQERKYTTISVKVKDIEKYCVDEKVTGGTIVNMCKTRQTIKDKFISKGLDYSDDLLLKAIDEYLKTK